MTTQARSALIAVIVLLAGACSDATGPLEINDTRLTFAAWAVRPGQDPVPELEVQGRFGEIAFQGAIGTPYPCYDITASVQGIHRQIQLNVTATSNAPGCIGVVATFAYQGLLDQLRPGTYQIRLTHTVDGHATQVLDTTAEVL